MGQQDKTYNYQEIFSKYFFQENTTSNHICPDHVLVFVYSGELIVRNNHQEVSVKEGEYIFLCRDSNIILEKRTFADQPFRSAFMGFNQSFLNEFYRNLNKNRIPKQTNNLDKSIIEIAKNPYLESLYISIKPYFEWDQNPIKEVLEIKLTEAIYCLLAVDKKKFSCLFDTILKTQKNISSTQKCTLNSNKDITTKCLDTVCLKMQYENKITNIYIEVRYKNISNIIQIYDERYKLSLLN